jgi:BirA family biotin operon repressor/biotin-[acetyl-CoA-carboxylase] ligase
LKKEILKMLKDNRSGFVSGQQISEQLGVSRTAIWKYINQIKEDGYEIESTSKKGYRIVSAPDLLTYEEVELYLNTSFIGRNIIHFDTIDSTNSKAKQLADSLEDGTILISEEQTSGRGRLGRSWVSPKYKGVWMSIVLKPDLNPMEAVKLTQVAAAAVVLGSRALGIETLVKWPNDIVINHKKTCGILTEMSAELTRINYVVVGIGINVNIDETDFPEDIKEIATSLKVETGSSINRQKLVGSILNNFEVLYKRFVHEDDMVSSLKICRDNSALIGNCINVIKRDGSLEARALDIDEEGRLLVEYPDGTKEFILSGEVSIRGKGSYI